MAIPDDPRTVEELFAATLQGDYDDEAAWDAVRSLQLKATPEVFDLARKYCLSDDPKARARALDVLGQFGAVAGKRDSERPYLDECRSIATAGLSDHDPLVVNSAAWALSHLQGQRAVTALIKMRYHSDASVRRAVACGMCGCTENRALQTLIELMEDLNDDVRDWATFELGAQCDADSPEIRNALRKRLEDPHVYARNEAIWGLVKRKDPLGLQLLLERLELESWVDGDEWAAAEVLGLTEADTSPDDLRLGLRRLLQLN